MKPFFQGMLIGSMLLFMSTLAAVALDVEKLRGTRIDKALTWLAAVPNSCWAYTAAVVYLATCWFVVGPSITREWWRKMSRIQREIGGDVEMTLFWIFAPVSVPIVLSHRWLFKPVGSGLSNLIYGKKGRDWV